MWPVLAVLAAFYLVTVSARVSAYGVDSFVHIGEDNLRASRETSFDAPHIDIVWKGEGYDGQYYWAIAVDPVDARGYIPDALEGYVYSRPFYPAVARLASLGSPEAVPYAMLAVNLLAVGAGTLALGFFLRRRHVSPWYALVFGLYPGLVLCVFRDLTEPLAFGVVALAALAFDRRTPAAIWCTGGLLAAATLTRETVVLFSLAAAIALVAGVMELEGRELSRRVRWTTGVTFFLLTILPLLAWRGLLLLWLESPTQERWDGWVSLAPFYGLVTHWPFDGQHWLTVATVVVPTLLALAGVPFLLRERRGAVLGGLLAANAAAFVIFLPSPVHVDWVASARAAIGVVLATVFCIPLFRERIHRAFPVVVALSWSLIWFFAASLAFELPGYNLITRSSE